MGFAFSFAFTFLTMMNRENEDSKRYKIKFLMKVKSGHVKIGHGERRGGGAVRRRGGSKVACLVHVGLWGFSSELTKKRTKRDCD
jgi:hypothetical protein